MDKPVERNFTFNLTESETNTVLNSLAEMPFKVVAGLLNKIQLQANEQVKQPKPDNDAE